MTAVTLNCVSLTGNRYRFSVSFLEYFLMNGLQSPHKLFNKYLEAHITCPPGDTGDSFTLGEPDLISVVDVGGFDWDRLQSGSLLSFHF